MANLCLNLFMKCRLCREVGDKLLVVILYVLILPRAEESQQQTQRVNQSRAIYNSLDVGELMIWILYCVNV